MMNSVDRSESTWMAQCPKCGWCVSLEELGWVRIGAVSVGKRTRMKCPECDAARWMHIIQIDENGQVIHPSRRKILIVVASIILGVITVIFGVFKLIETMLGNHAVYKLACQTALEHSVVKNEIGEPAETEMFRGSIRNGFADIEIPISGPKGAGKLLVKGNSIGPKWVLTELRLAVDHDQENPPPPIKLLKEP